MGTKRIAFQEAQLLGRAPAKPLACWEDKLGGWFTAPLGLIMVQINQWLCWKYEQRSIESLQTKKKIGVVKPTINYPR